jgi:hypothetical protein
MAMKHWFLVPPTQGRQELEQGAAMLMDLAGAEVRAASETMPPRCGADLLRMGADCRRRGMELVIVRDGDFKFLYLTEIEFEKMEEFRVLADTSQTYL